jgi:hypothetical protein
MALCADGALLVELPRYQAFTDYAECLARNRINFREIAGNRGPILVSALVPSNFNEEDLNVLMKQPILTRPGTQRIVFTAPVNELGWRIAWQIPMSCLEHVYDY